MLTFKNVKKVVLHLNTRSEKVEIWLALYPSAAIFFNFAATGRQGVARTCRQLVLKI